MFKESRPQLAENPVNKNPLLSIVVPVYNERQALPLLYERVTAVLQSVAMDNELILVDDGSKDGSDEWIKALAMRAPNIRAVRLSRNFGKEAALTAGIDHAHGDAVIILDADLQDPPELIPKMLQAWRDGADVVAMKRRTRAGETFSKRASAHLFYRLLNRISDTDIPADTGDFRLMSRKAVNALAALPERNRYMKGLFAWIGLPTTVIEYDRAPREAGQSQWNYFGLLRLAFEGITSFSIAPLRLATLAGVTTALIGMLFAAWIVVKTLVMGEPTPGYPSLIALITFLGGVQLVSIGLLGEYMGKTYFEAKQRPVYLLRDVSQSKSTPMARTQGQGHHRDAA